MLWFLFEVVLFVDVLDDLLVLVLHVLDLLLEVLELGVESLYLLRAAHVATLHRLSNCRVRGGIQLGADPSSSLFHLYI
jgi:hypothetical protein